MTEQNRVKLPFLDSDSELYLNLGILLIVIEKLARTKRGTQVLNNRKIHIFIYLIKNPVMLNHILNSIGSDSILLNEKDTYSVNSLVINFDSLLDRGFVKSLLAILVSKQLVNTSYKKQKGYFFSLTDEGIEAVDSMQTAFFNEVRVMSESLLCMQSLADSKLNELLNIEFKRTYRDE